METLRATYKNLDTETLKWMDYKFKHCNSDCENCPCNDISYRCGFIHELAEKELSRREK
nr:MAG TPA: TRYPSIN INHIBITOR INHIBITOR, BETA-TREFOIL FOLD, KUNITZ.24A [Microviridae sp.]